jgi:hypothetical protein
MVAGRLCKTSIAPLLLPSLGGLQDFHVLVSVQYTVSAVSLAPSVERQRFSDRDMRCVSNNSQYAQSAIMQIWVYAALRSLPPCNATGLSLRQTNLYPKVQTPEPAQPPSRQLDTVLRQSCPASRVPCTAPRRSTQASTALSSLASTRTDAGTS